MQISSSITWRQSKYLGRDESKTFRVFLQTHNIDNDGNIGIRGFTTLKQKNPEQNVIPSEY